PFDVNLAVAELLLGRDVAAFHLRIAVLDLPRRFLAAIGPLLLQAGAIEENDCIRGRLPRHIRRSGRSRVDHLWSRAAHIARLVLLLLILLFLFLWFVLFILRNNERTHREQDKHSSARRHRRLLKMERARREVSGSSRSVRETAANRHALQCPNRSIAPPA